MITPPGTADIPSKEWIPLQESLSSTTTNKHGENNTDNKAKYGVPAAQKAAGDLSKRLDEGAPTRDAESGAFVWYSTSGNGSVVVVYEGGLTVTRHADGTVQRWRRGEGGGHSVDSGLVLVECPGFASIEVSLLGDTYSACVFDAWRLLRSTSLSRYVHGEYQGH